jgi:hypothetical protein
MKCLRPRNVARVIGTILVVLLCAAAVEACPNCKEALAANDPEQSGVVRGYFYSILFMMGMPFAFIGCFSVYMYRQVLKARAGRAARDEQPPQAP